MLCSIFDLTNKEKQIIDKLERYFKSNNMSFKDKIFHAMLIAQHDLEAHHFTNENERQQIIEFKETLDGLFRKLA